MSQARLRSRSRTHAAVDVHGRMRSPRTAGRRRVAAFDRPIAATARPAERRRTPARTAAGEVLGIAILIGFVAAALALRTFLFLHQV